MKKFIFLFTLAAVVFAANKGYCGVASMQELKQSGRVIGVSESGAAFISVKQEFPNAKIVYLNGSEGYVAVQSGRIDAYAFSRNQMEFAISNGLKGVKLFPDNIGEATRIAVGISRASKVENLQSKINQFLSELKSDGTLQDMYRRWVVDEKTDMPDIDSPKNPEAKIKIGTIGLLPPFSYYEGDKLIGYDIELARRFSAWLGAEAELRIYDYGGLIAAGAVGDIDCIMANLNITPERAEKIDFSDVLFTEEVALMVKDGGMSIDDLSGKKVGVITGTRSGEIVKRFIPKANLEYIDTPADNLIALRTGKIDAFCTNLPMGKLITRQYNDVDFLGEPLTAVDVAPIFPKTETGKKLCGEFSEFVKKQWENGTIQKLDSVWFGNDESKKVVKDYSLLPAPNGVLKIAVDLSLVPFTYVKDNKIVGYDVDIAVMFCEAYGYGIEFVPMSFGAIIMSLQSGKCDFSACSIAYTEEREQKVSFSYPTLKSGSVLLVRKPDSALIEKAKTPPFIDDIKSSIERTFIREDRWKLFISGIINTMIITVLSIISGTILGFAVYLSCRGGNFAANLITRFFVWLIHGTPVVVLLMILYYIIFGGIDIAGIWVAVIAFSMTFGAGFYSMLSSGVNAIDKGQTEAAYALGFTDRETFFTIVLPQAALHFMPAYKAEVVALIKATAVVGYIAVQDLTKMGDIVRSRTYEAFFPLIAVAAIYFVLAGLLNFIVGAVNNRLKPKRKIRRSILKGIQTND